MRTALIVLGMHRSGTSAMARVLSLAGATLPRRLLEPSDGNPSGHWEPKEVMRLNDELLRVLGSDWYDPFASRLRGGADIPDCAMWRQRAADVLKGDYGDAPLIVLKDPRISVLTRFWTEVLIEQGWTPCPVIMSRHPAEVAKSLGIRQAFSPDHSVLLWVGYMLAAERDTRSLPRLFVDYDLLLRDWRGVLDRLCCKLGVELRPTEAQSRSIDFFLDPGLRRARADEGEPVRVWKWASELHRWFVDASDERCPDEAHLARAGSRLQAAWQVTGGTITDLRVERDSLARVSAELASAREQSERDLGDCRVALAHANARNAALLAEVRQWTLRWTEQSQEARRLEGELLARVDEQVAALAVIRGELDQAVSALATQRAEVARVRDERLALERRLDEIESDPVWRKTARLRSFVARHPRIGRLVGVVPAPEAG